MSIIRHFKRLRFIDFLIRKRYYYEEDVEMVQSLFTRKGKDLSREEVKNIMADNNTASNLCFSKNENFEVCNNP